MTTLGRLVQGYGFHVAPLPTFDIDAVTGQIYTDTLTASGTGPIPILGSPPVIWASIAGWVNQDDDAHEPCSLTACRAPLHPGPCKGWKGTLHSVSPHIWKQVEDERVAKANARRVKRIADLRSQGKPIPRKLLTEIKAKPAPGTGSGHTHPATGATPTPLGKVNQQADLAGGQAHNASQAINQAAGIKTNTAPLPTGPKGKKPTVAGRGPAFVITQPKVTDQYKLDKASKLTAQEWSDLSPADRTAIRDELEAIKVRGFGPQQTRADALLAKLPAGTTLGGTTPASAPAAPHVPSAAPGKTTLGQATKLIPAPSTPTPTPQLPAPAPAPQRGTRDSLGVLNRPLPGGSVTSTSVGLPSGYRISRDGMGYSLKHNGKLIRTSSTQAALEKYAHDHANVHGGNATPPTPPAPPSGTTPQAPGPPSNTPQAFPPHLQHARAVAGRALGGRPTAKTHVDVYGKLSKDDFDRLDTQTQRTIRDDLANAKAKFLDPKKSQAAQDLLDRFGSRHTGPAPGAPAATAPSGTPTPAPTGGRKTFTVTHNGKTVTRTSNQPYTHASIVRWPDGTEGVVSFHNSEAAALKGVLTAQQKQNGAQVVKAVAVKVDTPSAPAHPKGYSDPQQQVVKAAASAAPTDDVLKAVARLSPEQVGKLDDVDKRTVLGRLAFIATHPKATDAQKASAAAYGRMINKGSPAQTSRKWDHTPSLGELHGEEKTSGVQQRLDALDAAKAPRSPATAAARLQALSALTKPQFDALNPDEQRQILDALQALHRDRIHNGGDLTLDAGVEKAVIAYTGDHPAVHRLKQAEADFRAGKIDGDQLYAQFATARVQAPPTTHKAALGVLDKEAARVARDNPTLPPYVRSSLAGQPAYGAPGYYPVSHAGMKHNWEPAPRLSSTDISQIFRTSDSDLNALDPIHAQAVRDLRVNILRTGLRGEPGVPTGSPWSEATRNDVVDHYLGIHMADGGEIPRDRLDLYRALPGDVQTLVLKTVRKRLAGQSDNHAKTRTWMALRELEGDSPLDGATRDALVAASDKYARTGAAKADAYRQMDPAAFRSLPDFARGAIKTDLGSYQKRLENAGPSRWWSPQDNALAAFPSALAAHLEGSRVVPADRESRNVADIASYGRDLVAPASRVETYNKVTPIKLTGLPDATQKAVFDDLGKIENDSSLPLQTRYDAAMNKDVLLKLNSQVTLTPNQVSAVQAADPHPTAGYSDPSAALAFHNLSKADYDALSPTFREAIDERINNLPASPRQVMTAKFHPAPVVSNLPSGTVPTSVQPNVPQHVQDALDTIYGVHPKSHTMAHQLSTYGGLRGGDFNNLNVQEQQHLLSDLSFIQTTAKGPSATKAGKLIDRFTPPGTPAGQTPGNPAIIPPANSVPGQVRYPTPVVGTLVQATNKGKGGDGWISTPGGKSVWGKYGAAGLLLMHQDPGTGEKRYLMVQRGPGISDPGKWQFPGGAIDEKETFHQGGAREVIEELGFKDSDLASAAIHGEHTNAIPGTTWKYVSIAAQVPKMLKPDLSTHHARQETSDAKWMTESEIKALDTSGKLLAPLAGGKLEQNVMSLFPATGGQKLGQIARPGPVSKRLGRLSLPPGGRQAPASFNAWPHPHKKSTGKNLVGSKADIDAQRQKIKNDRKLFDGKTADGRLAAIGAQQGFDDTPTVVSKSEIDRLLATGDYIEAWRGVTGAGGGWSPRGRGGSGGKTAADINEEMRSGPAYYGTGIFGNGYYLATQKRVAEQYSDRTKGSIVRMLIPKSAVMEKYDKVEKEAQANSSRTSKAKGSSGYELSTFWDPGRWGAAKGLDGIEINPHHRAHAGGGAGHVASAGKPAFNWLNRSVLIIQKEPG